MEHLLTISSAGSIPIAVAVLAELVHEVIRLSLDASTPITGLLTSLLAARTAAPAPREVLSLQDVHWGIRVLVGAAMLVFGLGSLAPFFNRPVDESDE